MRRRWQELESGRISDILKSKAYFEQLVEFHWQYYSELAFQRNQIREQLKSCLREKACPFQCSRWQRVVKYRYSLSPLSTKGSLVDPGGRFNVGEIDRTRYPVFPALYLACDKGTALAEVLGREEDAAPLTPEELALTKPDSITVISVSCKLESVLDVRDGANLAGFVNLVRDFRLSRSLTEKARKFRFPVRLVRSTTELLAALEQRDWRNWPMACDVPAACQVFGGLVMNAGIEGILYNSSITQKQCLAIFPQNFQNSSAFVQIDDTAPNVGVRCRIDSSNFNDVF